MTEIEGYEYESYPNPYLKGFLIQRFPHISVLTLRLNSARFVLADIFLVIVVMAKDGRVKEKRFFVKLIIRV